MDSSRGILLLVALLSPLRAQSPAGGTLHDARIEDLVVAADGRLGVYARNLDSGAELSLNGVLPFPARHVDRLLLALAALDRARSGGGGPATEIDFPATVYRGAASRLAAALGKSVSVAAAIEALLAGEDLAAGEALAVFVHGHVPPRFAGPGTPVPTSRATVREIDRKLLAALDSRFDAASDEATGRWLHDTDATGVVPVPFAEDPRRLPDFGRRFRSATAALDEPRLSPKAAAELFAQAWRGDGLAPEDHAVVRRALSRATTLRSADELPLESRASGSDGVSWQGTGSTILVETSRGTVVIATGSLGFGTGRTGDGLLATLARGALRRLAPGFRTDSPPAPTLPGLALTLQESGRARELAADFGTPLPADSRATFAANEDLAVVVAVAAEEDLVVHAQWTLPNGELRTLRAGVDAKGFRRVVLALPNPGPGSGRVAIAIGGQPLFATRWSVQPRGG